MGGFLGRLLGSKDAIQDVVSNVRDGLDALVYTDEEREHDAKAERAEAREMLIEWLRATQGQNLARRLIALIVVSLWVALYSFAAILATVGAWAGAEFTNAAGMLHDFANGMSTELMLVLAFYFGATHMAKLIDLGIAKSRGSSR